MIKRITKLTAVLIAAVFSLANSVHAEDTAKKWYELDPDQTVVIELALKPGESKPVQVASKAPLIVGYETDISASDNAAYAYPKPSVVLRSKESEVSGPKGASTLWQVHGGNVSLTIENKTKLNLKIAIYQGPKPADWTGDALP